jgi:hypothetical protein
MWPNANTPAVEHVVDNRVFLLGLDGLYRDRMKWHERDELLQCARRVANRLAVQPATGPVEGYYAEEPELAEYFQLMRGLQAEHLVRERDVAALPEYQRLLAVTSSPIFGMPQREKQLLPRGRDSLSAALHHAVGQGQAWSLPLLVPLAAKLARDSRDYSLVGLAAIAEDPVVMTALRESVVLYAEMVLGSAMLPRPEYVWRVDPYLAQQAARFVDTFNDLMQSNLPAPVADHAALFWQAAALNEVLGRCVCLGQALKGGPSYHWAIRQGPGDELAVHEFWESETWTTQRYRAARLDGGRLQDGEVYQPRWNRRMTE